ncbi:MAG: hypothetical protein PHS86_14830 [Syntrophaceae bacterium]|nr:hypothetical protein [Syntrophaceae bacterium]
MSSDNSNKNITALLFSTETKDIQKLSDVFSTRGIELTVVDSAADCLQKCMIFIPDLLIVEDDPGTDVGIKIVRDVLKISWTVSSILISPLEDNEIHDRAEGLGILGSISALDDFEKLNYLLDTFEKFRIN